MKIKIFTSLLFFFFILLNLKMISAQRLTYVNNRALTIDVEQYYIEIPNLKERYFLNPVISEYKFIGDSVFIKGVLFYNEEIVEVAQILKLKRVRKINFCNLICCKRAKYPLYKSIEIVEKYNAKEFEITVHKNTKFLCFNAIRLDQQVIMHLTIIK